jgi:hypothetical protein
MSERFATRKKMDPLIFRLRAFLTAWAALIMLWSLSFMVVEDRSFLDAVYFTVVTVTTVGYGDIHATTAAGKVMAMLVILTGAGTFMGLVASVTDLLLNRRDRRVRMEKLNMVVGAFFSEVGRTLLVYFSDFDTRLEQIKGELVVGGDWKDEKFHEVAERIRSYSFQMEAARVDFEHLRVFLSGRRTFLLRLIENPTLMEHELFTDLLLAVFHLTEELTFRKQVTDLLPTDRAHLAGDANRIYGLLVHQWLDHMHYLKSNYPYLFSLAIRTNPFDEKASPVVTG